MMKRRQFIISTSGTIGLTAIAGCGRSNPARRPSIQSVNTDKLELQVTVTNADLADSIQFDVQGGSNETKTVSESEPTAIYQLGNPETIGTEDQKLSNGAEFSIRLNGEIEGDEQSDGPVDTREWVFNPGIELTNVVKAEEIEYTPESHSQAATPVFEIANSGNVPTRLKQLAILNFDQEIPLQNSNVETGFARTAISQRGVETRIKRVDPHENGDHYIPVGETARFAVDGLLTHTGEPPESTDSHDQQFVASVRWLGGDKSHQITARLKGGIQESEGTEDYRFNDFEIVEIANYNPIDYRSYNNPEFPKV
jgi:hypothetical protein